MEVLQKTRKVRDEVPMRYARGISSSSADAGTDAWYRVETDAIFLGVPVMVTKSNECLVE